MFIKYRWIRKNYETREMHPNDHSSRPIIVVITIIITVVISIIIIVVIIVKHHYKITFIVLSEAIVMIL